MSSRIAFPLGERGYLSFLRDAKATATRVLREVVKQRAKRRELYEAAMLAVHRIMLSPFLASGETVHLDRPNGVARGSDGLTVTSLLQRGLQGVRNGSEATAFIKNCVARGRLPTRAKATCVAVGVNVREARVANARVSSYGMSVPLVTDFLRAHGHGEIESRLVAKYGCRFFTESLDLYFCVFGRGNTLNERLLDHATRWQSADAVALIFESADLVRDQDGNECVVSIEETENGSPSLVSIKVGRNLWHELITDEQGAIDAAYFRAGWNVFRSLIVDCLNHANVSHEDWVPEASQEVSREIGPRLRRARSKGEAAILRAPGAIAGHLDTLYPEADVTTAEKLSRMVTLLQGSICLVPWAKAEDVPLPVVTFPAVADDGAFRCGWTLIPSEHDFDLHQFVGIRNSLLPLFGQAAGQDLTNQASFNDSLHKVLEGLADCISSDEFNALNEALAPFNTRFLELIEAAKELTGDAHEARETSYRFIYGAPETLKHIARVVSNEVRAHSLEGLEKPESLALTCRGHYSVFQQPGFVGFVDQFHGSLVVNKVVILRAAPDDALLEMRSEDLIVDDSFRDLRWLTWRLEDPERGAAAALAAGGDGVLRVFVAGKLILTWRKFPPPDADGRWKLGLELGDQNSSAIGRLRRDVMAAMGYSPDDVPFASVRDLVSAISTISETPGEGALFIIGGAPWQDQALCDMVPDNFKMDWAQDRRLNGVEQRVLQSLAVMDGAVHIAADGRPNGHWVCARRYIAAAPSGRNGVTLNAEVLVKEYLERWIANLQSGKTVCKNAHDEEIKHLESWRHKLGTKGTRHRSVFQLCCLWYQQRRRRDSPLICSISADGPVHLYQVKVCDTCKKRYLWTNDVIS